MGLSRVAGGDAITVMLGTSSVVSAHGLNSPRTAALGDCARRLEHGSL
jgi:hypothetical protein